MPYDTNGNYTLPTIYYAISGTVINPSQHNSPFEDVQTALNQVFLRNGSAPLTGVLKAGGNKITGLAKGSANGEAVTFDQISGFVSKTDADTRYVKNNNVTAGGIISADMDASGVPSFQSGSGKWYPVQLQGDYATNSSLNSEVQRATTIEGNLQTSKANLDGGNQFSGDQTVKGSVTVGMGGWSGGTEPGQGRWSNGLLAFGAPLGTTSTYTGFFQITDLMGNVGDNYSGINMFGVDYSGKRYDWYFPWNGNIQTPKGLVAFQSDLQNYALLSQLPLDPSKIILAWSGYVGGGDQSIPYPRGVSSVDTVVVSCSRQASGNKATAVINVQSWDNSSVQVNTVWVGGSSQGNSDTNFRAILVGNK